MSKTTNLRFTTISILILLISIFSGSVHAQVIIANNESEFWAIDKYGDKYYFVGHYNHPHITNNKSINYLIQNNTYIIVEYDRINTQKSIMHNIHKYISEGEPNQISPKMIKDIGVFQDQMYVLFQHRVKHWIISFNITNWHPIIEETQLNISDEATFLHEIEITEDYIILREDNDLYLLDRSTLDYIQHTEFLPGGLDDTGGIGNLAWDGKHMWVWTSTAKVQSSRGRSSFLPGKIFRFNLTTGHRDKVIDESPDEAGFEYYGSIIDMVF